MGVKEEDFDALRNLEDGYCQIKEIFHIQVDRLKTSDEKLNMILVFNGAISLYLSLRFRLRQKVL